MSSVRLRSNTRATASVRALRASVSEAKWLGAVPCDIQMFGRHTDAATGSPGGSP